MARTVAGAAALPGAPAFSAECATQAVEVICRICAQVSRSRSASAARVCAGLARARAPEARTRESVNAKNDFIGRKPPRTLLRTCIAHLEQIQFLLQTAQHFVINLIMIAHVQQGRALQGADVPRELAITNEIFVGMAGLARAVPAQQIQTMFLDANQVL